MLRKCSESTEKEVESVLEEYGKFGNRRIGCGGGERLDVLDVGPSQVDVEKEEKGAEANDRRIEIVIIAREPIEQKMPVDFLTDVCFI